MQPGPPRTTVLRNEVELHMPAAKKPPRARTGSAKIAENTVDAEATNTRIPFAWQGEVFFIDVAAVEYGRGAFALRRVGNEALRLIDRVNAMIDVLECAIGQAQLARVVELTPRIFDDHDTMRSFWEGFNVAVHGAGPGESSAS